MTRAGKQPDSPSEEDSTNSINIPTCLSQARDRFSELGQLPDNWGGSEKPSDRSLSVAWSIVQSMERHGHHVRHIAPIADGGLAVRYADGTRSARFDVYNDGGIVIVSRVARGSAAQYEELSKIEAVAKLSSFLQYDAAPTARGWIDAAAEDLPDVPPGNAFTRVIVVQSFVVLHRILTCDMTLTHLQIGAVEVPFELDSVEDALRTYRFRNLNVATLRRDLVATGAAVAPFNMIAVAPCLEVRVSLLNVQSVPAKPHAALLLYEET